MIQDEDGFWWPPEEVTDMIKEQVLTADALFNASIIEGTPVDLDAHEAYLYDWYSGEQLESALDYVQNYRDGASISVATWHGECLREVQEWSADGLECTYGVSCQDGTLTEYDPFTGEIVNRTHIDYGGLIRLRMRYDPSNGHWKFHTLTGYTPIGGD
jgi:hypothetical protein